MKECWIVCSGNPQDGFNFYGTFESTNAAVTWAENQHWNDAWWACKLNKVQ